jgi:catechol 2,3-dioxygenase-like lactoylglutathione lyase family enzyme
MAAVSVRYIVNDVDEAILFYVQHLGFTEEMHPAHFARWAPVSATRS